MRRALMGLAVLAFAVATACGAVTPAPAASTVSVGQPDAGRTVQVRVGDTVHVTLQDSFPVPGSSLVWNVTSSDGSVLQPGTATRIPQEVSGFGAHRTYTADFHAMVAGQAALNAVGATTCEAMAKQNCPDHVFKITIVVTG